MSSKCTLELARLRRLALATQGLLHAKPYGSGLEGARKAINHIGYVQIDSITVVERAHHHILHSREYGYMALVKETEGNMIGFHSHQ